jgi:hypothetical protein
VLAVEHFRQFLYGVSFVVITDHQPLKYLLTIKEPNSRLMRWLNRLNMFTFTIVYRKGIKNGNADALSRLPTEPDEDEDVTTEQPIIINVIIAESEALNEDQLTDPNLLWFSRNKLKKKINTTF